MSRSLVAVQIASDLFEYPEKARSIQVYMSTFDAGIGQIRGELNSYSTFCFFVGITALLVKGDSVPLVTIKIHFLQVIRLPPF